MPKYVIELQRSRVDYAEITIDAADDCAAEQEAYRMARDNEIKWALGDDAEEADIVSFECVDEEEIE